MDKETKDIAKDMLATIASGKDYSEIKDFHTIFADAETIISALAYLIGPLLTAEQTYRKVIVGEMEHGDSHAKAEAKAKASDAYLNYRKLQYAYDLAQEQIMLLKKWKDALELEYGNAKRP